jgi:hypothetical protein
VFYKGLRKNIIIIIIIPTYVCNHPCVVAGEVKELTTPMNAKSEPAWKKRIHKTIECYRIDLAILNGVPTHQVCLKAHNIFKKCKVNENIETLKQDIKMKLPAKAQQLRRYAKKSHHYQQIELFNEVARRFYRQINNQQTDVQEPPTRQQT